MCGIAISTIIGRFCQFGRLTRFAKGMILLTVKYTEFVDSFTVT